MSYASTDNPKVEVPYLRLRGRWLQDAGFDIGRNVNVEVSADRDSGLNCRQLPDTPAQGCVRR